MLRATLSSCSMRSRSILSCSRSCWVSICGLRFAPLLEDLASGYAMDSDARHRPLPSARHGAHEILSIVGAACCDTAYHLVAMSSGDNQAVVTNFSRKPLTEQTST